MFDSGQKAADNLVELLDLERIEDDIFRGQNAHAIVTFRLYGGQVAAQALMAAGRTVEPDRFVHSLHSYFIRPGDPEVPVVFTVDRIRDGGSFTTRRVVARQRGLGIFALEASFQLEQPGVEHQLTMPARPGPAELDPDARTDGLDLVDPFLRSWPFERRRVPIPADDASGSSSAAWIKISGTLPDDPLLHACALTFVSDLVPATAVLSTHTGTIVDRSHARTASLDHAVWFHGRCRADEWLLYEGNSPSSSGSRGLAMGQVYTEDGRQVASLAQEIMIRVKVP